MLVKRPLPFASLVRREAPGGTASGQILDGDMWGRGRGGGRGSCAPF